MDANYILDEMDKMFPDAECALHHRNPYELIIAVVLSAQTTDEAVNKVTPALFQRFPTPEDLMEGDITEIESYLTKIGLYRNKSKMIKSLSTTLVLEYNSQVPATMKELTSLAGVGRKTANVVLSVAYDIPAFAVDTHVERVSKRLGLAKFDDKVEDVERKLKRKLDRNRWNKAHHSFIFFGRYHCKALRPNCEECVFAKECKREQFEQYKKKKK
ncbi:MAG: endonuclease III [Eubacteriales bacterium]